MSYYGNDTWTPYHVGGEGNQDAQVNLGTIGNLSPLSTTIMHFHDLIYGERNVSFLAGSASEFIGGVILARLNTSTDWEGRSIVVDEIVAAAEFDDAMPKIVQATVEGDDEGYLAIIPILSDHWADVVDGTITTLSSQHITDLDNATTYWLCATSRDLSHLAGNANDLIMEMIREANAGVQHFDLINFDNVEFGESILVDDSMNSVMEITAREDNTGGIEPYSAVTVRYDRIVFSEAFTGLNLPIVPGVEMLSDYLPYLNACATLQLSIEDMDGDVDFTNEEQLPDGSFETVIQINNGHRIFIESARLSFTPVVPDPLLELDEVIVETDLNGFTMNDE